MLLIKEYLKLFALLACIFYSASLHAASNDELISLEAEMLRYMDTNDRESFTRVAEKLKETSKEAGDERFFYRAWGNQSIYEATHQYYTEALDIAKQMMDYAREDGSIYGEYAALHTNAMMLMQQQDYDAAQKAFLEASDFRRRHFPNESAAEDLRELMKIAYLQGDIEMAKKFGYQLLAEPNVTPHHKGRTLSRLSIMAFDENNVEDFNHIYEEMKRLSQTDGIKSINLFTELNYHIINADYKQALMLVDRLAADSCAERKALIYHRLGDNEKAYEYMVEYKRISDSIARVSHDRDVASLYLRMNNDRLRLEQELLIHQNSQLRYRFYFALGIVLMLVLLFFIYQRHKIVRTLKKDNRLLNYGKKDAERALEDLNELSFYESKSELPLTTSVKVNKLGDHLTNVTQNQCNRGVTVIFQTELPDDFEITTNSEALKKLLTQLLNESSRYTSKGFIKLKCEERGDNVRFSVTDTSLRLADNSKNNKSDMSAAEGNTARYTSMSFNICQSISRLLHGRIWRDAEYPDGALVVFEIPK